MSKTAILASSISRNGGGLFYSVRRLVQAVAAEGSTELEVLGLQDEYTQEDLAQWAPVRARAFPIQGPRGLGYSPALKRAVQVSDFGLLHNHGLWMHPSRVALDWAKRTRRPFMVSPHGMLDPWALSQSRLKKALAGAWYQIEHLQAAACIHSLCEAETLAIRRFGLGMPVCQIPNGVDLPGPGVGRPAPWAKQVKPADKVLLSLGRLHPKKGLAALIEAFSRTQKAHGAASQEWVLAIAGWDQGGHEAQLKDLAKAWGVQDRVVFTGPLFGPAKEDAFRAASAFVLPSHSEGLPVVVLEAWSYGLPVLMTAECNLPEGFAHGAALRVSTKVDELERSLDAFFRSAPDERQAMGRRGLALVEAQFTWKNIGRDMAAVYQWLQSGGPAPACVTV